MMVFESIFIILRCLWLDSRQAICGFIRIEHQSYSNFELRHTNFLFFYLKMSEEADF